MHHLPSTPLQLGRGGTTDDDDFAGEFGEGGFVDWDGCHCCLGVCCEGGLAAFLNVVGTAINAGSLPGFSATIVIGTLARNSEYQSALAWKCVNGTRGILGQSVQEILEVAAVYLRRCTIHKSYRGDIR